LQHADSRFNRPILTVALNAAVDISYVSHRFATGKLNMATEVTRVAGGKANNVARVASSLGQPVIATGFAAGAAGRFIQENLHAVGVRAEFVECDGENRTCLTIVDPQTPALTELREPGPLLTEADADRFLARFSMLIRQVELVVISGSLPAGIPDDFYAQLVREAYRTAQVRCIVDASGKALREVTRVQPYMVKPNLEELEEWTGRSLRHDDEILEAARALQVAGPLVVAVSLGSRGMQLVAPEGAWRVTVPLILPANTVGCGDALVAGFASGLMQQLNAEDVLRLAVACGTASALTNSVATVSQDDLDRIHPGVRVERML
jgi:tagatose 6-phosphate kinase